MTTTTTVSEADNELQREFQELAEELNKAFSIFYRAQLMSQIRPLAAEIIEKVSRFEADRLLRLAIAVDNLETAMVREGVVTQTHWGMRKAANLEVNGQTAVKAHHIIAASSLMVYMFNVLDI